MTTTLRNLLQTSVSPKSWRLGEVQFRPAWIVALLMVAASIGFLLFARGGRGEGGSPALDSTTGIIAPDSAQATPLLPPPPSSATLSEENPSSQAPLVVRSTTSPTNAEPAIAQAPFEIVQVACGEEHTCVLLSSGSLYCFGQNRFGAAGLGRPGASGDLPGSMRKLRPVDLGFGAIVKEIAASRLSTAALLSNGQVKHWGLVRKGWVYNGLPVEMDPPKPADAVAFTVRGKSSDTLGDALEPLYYGPGPVHNLLGFCEENGGPLVVRKNSRGSFTLSPYAAQPRCQRESCPANILDFRFYEQSFSNYQPAYKSPAKVWASANRQCRQLPPNTTICMESCDINGGGTAYPFIAHLIAFQMSSTLWNSKICLVTNMGNLTCNGVIGSVQASTFDDAQEAFRQREQRLRYNRPDPQETQDRTPYLDGRRIVALSAGLDFVCAVLANAPYAESSTATTGASIACAGSNLFGQLGLGHTDDVVMSDIGKQVIRFPKPVKAIASGYYHTCATLVDNTLRCWGLNSAGQLGVDHTETIGDDHLETNDNLLPTLLGSHVSV